MSATINIEELIKQLQKIKNKTLSIRIIKEKDDDKNYWLENIDVSNTGDTGYELHGEVRLTGKES